MGTQQNNTIIDGQQKDSCIIVQPGNTATITQYIIKNGKGKYSFGGGINNGGTLTLENSTITNNAGVCFGGGIHNEYLCLMNTKGVTIKNNRVNYCGGGIYN